MANNGIVGISIDGDNCYLIKISFDTRDPEFFRKEWRREKFQRMRAAKMDTTCDQRNGKRPF